MTCGSQFAPRLRAQGFRMTPQRLAILHVLCHARIHLSPREVYKQAKQELPSLTEPTVYRTLEFLAENGLAHPSQKGNGHFLYEIADSDHHHHLVCRVCGDDVRVEHTALEHLYRKLESATGYIRIDSHMTFFGVCPRCQ